MSDLWRASGLLTGVVVPLDSDFGVGGAEFVGERPSPFLGVVKVESSLGLGGSGVVWSLGSSATTTSAFFSGLSGTTEVVCVHQLACLD